jgi:hypothetical protein
MLNCFKLSISLAKVHFKKIEIYCNSYWYERLKEEYFLQDCSLINCLDELDYLKRISWCFVKIHVYNLQKEPFIHLDVDVFLWDGIPTSLHTKDVIFQQWEYPKTTHRFYKTGLDVLKKEKIVSSELLFKDIAANMGVFAVLNVEIIKKVFEPYYNNAKLIVSKTNDWLIESDNDLYYLPVVYEQLFLVYYLEKYYSLNNKLLSENVGVLLDAYSKPLFNNYKYTHLIANSKNDKTTMVKVAKRVKEMNL